MVPVLGLDIGGANLKAAHSQVAEAARTLPFALWKDPGGLTAALGDLIAGMPEFDQLAVTMTGELCDCYSSKRAGVNAILDNVETVADSTPVHVWTIPGRFQTVAEVRQDPLLAAAANWLALATFAGRYVEQGSALLIDIGTTTTDIVPLWDGKPMPLGLTDPERMRSGELVYTGIKRTPICAMLGMEVAGELFATTRDAYLLLGHLPERETDCDTADGRPATKACAHARLARMLGGDGESTNPRETHVLARKVSKKQIDVLTGSIARVGGTLLFPPATWVLAGSGEFLGRLCLDRQLKNRPARVISLSVELGPTLSEAACAYAVAVLAAEFAETSEPGTQ